MESKGRRTGWWVAGAVVLVVAIFTLLERLIEGKPTPVLENPAIVTSPAPPEVLRLEDGGIEIRHDYFRRTTIRLGVEEDEQALYDCLVTGIEETFGEGTEGWGRGRVRQEAERIQDQCLTSVTDLPPPPGR